MVEVYKSTKEHVIISYKSSIALDKYALLQQYVASLHMPSENKKCGNTHVFCLDFFISFLVFFELSFTSFFPLGFCSFFSLVFLSFLTLGCCCFFLEDFLLLAVLFLASEPSVLPVSVAAGCCEGPSPLSGLAVTYQRM